MYGFRRSGYVLSLGYVDYEFKGSTLFAEPLKYMFYSSKDMNENVINIRCDAVCLLTRLSTQRECISMLNIEGDKT